MPQPSENNTSSQRFKDLLSFENRVKSILRFEAALARAEAKAGIIPSEAAVTITEVCNKFAFDAADLEARGSRAGTMVIPLVKDLISRTSEISPEAARYVHFGSTSQDVLDTAMILQLKEVVQCLNQDLERIESAFAKLAREHATTLLLGRTLLQPGPPITFGLKAAGWAAAIRRGRERLHDSASKALILQFGGAVGTLSSLGPDGLKVASALSAELNLPLPDGPWHPHRDRLMELASNVAIVVGSLGKIARDISLHMQPEIAELSEPSESGRGGSSAMPHKQNPIGCAVVLTAANRVPGMVSSLLSGMVQEHERGLGGWQAESRTLPELFLEAGMASTAMEEVSQGLQVNVENMQANLEATNEVVFSESLATALIEKLGRSEAQALVTQLVEKAKASNEKLSVTAASNETVLETIEAVDLKNIFSPYQCLGSTSELIERLLDGSVTD